MSWIQTKFLAYLERLNVRYLSKQKTLPAKSLWVWGGLFVEEISGTNLRGEEMESSRTHSILGPD